LSGISRNPLILALSINPGKKQHSPGENLR
jgi:hypothetical protein